jgi:hypothetical protein
MRAGTAAPYDTEGRACARQAQRGGECPQCSARQRVQQGSPRRALPLAAAASAASAGAAAGAAGCGEGPRSESAACVTEREQ